MLEVGRTNDAFPYSWRDDTVLMSSALPITCPSRAISGCDFSSVSSSPIL